LLFAAVVGAGAARSYQQVAKNAERSSRAIAQEHAARLEALLRQAQKIPEMMALDLEERAFMSDEELRAYMRAVLEKSRGEIYGSCVAFKPYGFQPDLPAYAPYFYTSSGGIAFEQLAKDEYNYFVWDWYRRPRDENKPVWSEPYFDEGGGKTLMITYSVPFRADGVFRGIVTIDIALAELLDQVQRIAETEQEMLGKGGYAFIISQQGKFLAFPGEVAETVMNRTLQSLNPDLARVMSRGGEGVLRTSSPRDGEKAWVAYAPILLDASALPGTRPRSEMSLGIVSVEAGAMDPAMHLLMAQLLIGLGGLAALFAAIIFVARSISRPIAELSSAAQQVAGGNLQLNIRSRPGATEVQELTKAFNTMTRDLRMQMEEVRYTTTLRERLEGELSAARSIQMSLLPKNFPAFPDRHEFDVHAIVRPAREVGGDFYDFFLIDEERLCVVIGDVSGKGVPAALFMAVSKSLIKATALGGHSTGDIIKRVNAELYEEATGGMFVTLLFAILQISTGEIEYCNAGHPPPFVVGSDGSAIPLDGEHAPALAIAAGLPFPVGRHRLAVGETLFFFTDGVTEALSKSRDFYTPRRLQGVLREVYALPVSLITRSVVRDVRAFSVEEAQTDDISVMALRWLGPLGAENAPGIAAAPQELAPSPFDSVILSRASPGTRS